jgi:hypothetical protein
MRTEEIEFIVCNIFEWMLLIGCVYFVLTDADIKFLIYTCTIYIGVVIKNKKVEGDKE